MNGIPLIKTLRGLNPIAQYLFAVSAAIVTYGVYALVAVPLIEGPAIVRRARDESIPATIGNERAKTELANWLPAGSWELEPCKTLETRQGTIYFQDYLPREDGILEVYPFTIVLRSSDTTVSAEASDSNRSPVILRASKQAELQFEDRVTLAGGAGRILGGQIQGTVHLFQPSSQPNGDDGFSVWTDNVHLNTQTISTLERVEFKFGKHSGSGRNLRIDLAHKSPLDAINTDFSKISGILRLELAFIDEISLHVEPAGQTNESDISGPLIVNCKGPFVFDFESNVASFQDAVSVTQIGKQESALSADLLELHFLQKRGLNTSQGGPRIAVGPSQQVEDQSAGLKLQAIVATGRPANVVLKSRNVRAKAERLEYDLIGKRLIGRDRHAVEVQHGTRQMLARDLDYHMREDGSIGTLLANGPGAFQGTTPRKQGGDGMLRVEWSDRLTIEQIDGGKLISVFGNAMVQLDDRARISGDRLQLAVSEMNLTVGEGENQEWEFHPVELVVAGNVAIETPEISGRTAKLTANWTDADRLIPLSFKTRINELQPTSQIEHEVFVACKPTGNQVAVQDYQPKRVLSLDQQPAGPWRNQESNHADPSPKLQVTGQLINASLRETEGATAINQLEIEGDVVVAQPNQIESAQPAWSVSGGRLVIIPQGNELHRMSVLGDARILSEQLEMHCAELQVDQAANRMWAPSNGTATVSPKSANPKSDSAQSPTTINIEWQGGMIFDGQRIYFENAVQANSTQTRTDGSKSEMRSLSEGLNLILDRPIDLQRLGQDDAPAEERIDVQKILLVNQIPDEHRAFPIRSNEAIGRPVLLEKWGLNAMNEALDRQSISVPRIVMNVASGDVNAQGPGTMIQWKRSTGGGGAAPFLSPRPQANDKSATPRETEIDYLQANFDGNLDANANRSEMKLSGRVRALYASVNSWDDSRDPDSTRIQSGETKITCEQVQIAQWSPRGSSKPITLIQANTNARILNDGFEATAERISYDEEADLLVIEGDGRQDANLWFKQNPTAERSHLVAAKIHYRPSDQWTLIEKVRNAQINSNR